jgi:hypothetical protein
MRHESNDFDELYLFEEISLDMLVILSHYSSCAQLTRRSFLICMGDRGMDRIRGTMQSIPNWWCVQVLSIVHMHLNLLRAQCILPEDVLLFP